MSEAPRPRQPWWIPPFLGRVPAGVESRNLSLLGAIALALFFEEYDLAMLTSALHRIAADLGMQETQFGLYLGIIRLGALPAFLVIPLADRLGRRRVFLTTVVCTGVFTFLSAFSQTPTQFVVLQMLTRTFFITGSAVAFVIVAEEFPANHRGWGIGMLGALGASGHGLGMLLYSQVEVLPGGWRALYVLGILPVLLLPVFRRKVTETARYHENAARRADHATGGGFAEAIRPLREVARHNPGRALGIALAGFLPAVGLISAFQFTGYYTQDVLGWSPGQYAAMGILGGGLGIIGNVAAGRLGDVFGRRAVGMVLLGSFPIWVGVFYNSSGWVLPVMWVGIVFASSGGRVILRTLATELFPTAQRASASGLFAILDATGAALGLFVLWGVTQGEGEFTYYTTILAVAVAAGALVLLFFPETTRRELEAISDDAPRVASPAPAIAGADGEAGDATPS